jgi:hypothetical protein
MVIFIKSKKLKYVIEAGLPLPSHQVNLCVRAEGTDGELNRIAFSALHQLLEIKRKRIRGCFQMVGISALPTPLRQRDAAGKYKKDIFLVGNASEEIVNHRECQRLVSTYETILSRAKAISGNDQRDVNQAIRS